jgi:hypothetical protein
MAKFFRGGQGQAQASQMVPNLAPARAAASDRAMMMRDAYSNGVRCKGFTVPIGIGTSAFSVDLSGMAKNFLGFGWYFFSGQPAGVTTAQLVINNDVVVDSTLIQHFQVNGATSDRDYFPFPRPLNGQDTIVFNFNQGGSTASTGYLIVYYI